MTKFIEYVLIGIAMIIILVAPVLLVYAATNFITWGTYVNMGDWTMEARFWLVLITFLWVFFWFLFAISP